VLRGWLCLAQSGGLVPGTAHLKELPTFSGVFSTKIGIYQQKIPTYQRKLPFINVFLGVTDNSSIFDKFRPPQFKGLNTKRVTALYSHKGPSLIQSIN
jgi:hypothetical protein